MSLTPQNNKHSMKRILESDWFFVGLIFFLTVIFFSQFLFSNGMFYSSDQMAGLDSRFFLKDALTRFHQLPMWFSTRLGGMPSIDAMFGDPFYIPSMIINFISPVHRAIGLKMVLHIFLAGVFFYLLLRRGFGCHRLIALTGALFYMLNPQFVSHIYPGHDGKMFVIAWVPFVIWRLKALIDYANLKNCAFLSFGIAMILLTSHIQMSYFVLWGLGFTWLFALIVSIADKKTTYGLKLSAYFWGAVVCALLIGIIQLVPSYMYIQNAFSVRGGSRGIDFAASWSLHWGEVFSLWIPEFVNSLDYYWGQNPFKLNSEYGGAVALILSVFSLISKPSKWRYFWAGVALFAISFGLGANSFVWTITYHLIPGVAKFRAASMIMFWFSFSTVLLSALFLKDMFAGRLSSLPTQERKKWTNGIYVSAAIVLLLTLVFSSQDIVKSLFSSVIGEKENVFNANFSKNYIPALWLWFLGVIAILALLLGNILGKVKPTIVVVCILVLGLIDVLRVDYQFIKMIDPRPYLITEPALKELQVKMKQEPFRCFTLPGTLPQNSEGIHGLEGVGGFHDNELRWYREFRGDQQDRNYIASLVAFNEKGEPYLDAAKLEAGSPFLDLANVRYLLVRAQNQQLVAVENKNALGRVSFAPGYIILDSSKLVEAIRNNSYDYRNVVALQHEPLVKPAPNSEVSTTTAFSSVWDVYSPNYRKVKVQVPANGFLRISESYYPGWKMLVDGKSVDVLQADQTWMAIPIGMGEHVIEMNVDSLYFGKVAYISIIMSGILLGYLIVAVFIRVKNRKK